MEKLLLTVWEAADVLSVSRSRVYELLYAEQPVWTGAGYCDPDTGVMLPTWRQALDHLDADPDAGPVHVMRFGTHHDIAGIVAPSADADRAVPYLAKYLTKAIGDPLGDNSESDPAREAHIDRLHAELRWLPARRGARTGCATASNPTGPAPAAVPARLMIENTSASAAVVSWSPATGPARPCPNTEPTGPRSSVKHCSPPAWPRPTWNGWPPTSSAQTGSPATCGPTNAPTPPPTP